MVQLVCPHTAGEDGLVQRLHTSEEPSLIGYGAPATTAVQFNAPEALHTFAPAPFATAAMSHGAPAAGICGPLAVTYVSTVKPAELMVMVEMPPFATLPSGEGELESTLNG